jgi:hypothetical protein
MQSATVRTVAVTIEPAPFGQAMRQAETAQAMELAGEMDRRRQGFMTTASDRRRAQAVTRREEELADGFAEMRFAGFVTVSARDGEELERASGEIEHAGQLARLEFQRMYGEQEAASPSRCRSAAASDSCSASHLVGRRSKLRCLILLLRLR